MMVKLFSIIKKILMVGDVWGEETLDYFTQFPAVINFVEGNFDLLKIIRNTIDIFFDPCDGYILC